MRLPETNADSWQPGPGQWKATAGAGLQPIHARHVPHSWLRKQAEGPVLGKVAVIRVAVEELAALGPESTSSGR